MSHEKGAPGCSFRVLGRARFWSCAPHSKRLFLCILNIVSHGFGSTRGQGPRLSIRPTGRNVFVFVRDVTHVQTCEKWASFFEFLGHTWNMSKPVMMFVFKVLRNQLFRHILETCPNLWWRSCSKCYAIDCFGTYLKHVQTCDDVRVQSATQSTASVHSWHMSKPVMTFVFRVLRNRLLRYILQTCPNLWWRSCSKCYAIDCFGTYFKHAQTCDDVRVQMLRNGLLRCILETCPNLWWRSCSKCYAIDCFGTYFKHVQTCDDVRVQMLRKMDCFGAYLKHVQTCDDVRVRSATQSTASVQKKKKKKGAWGRPNVQNLGPLSRMFCNPVKRCIFLHNDEIPMGTAWVRARATKDPKRGCLGYI